MSFINNHPTLARFAALPVALTLGLKESISVPYKGLSEGLRAVGLATFQVRVYNGRGIGYRFFESFKCGMKSVTRLAFSPVLSPIFGATKATEVFFKIMKDPANFGK